MHPCQGLVFQCADEVGFGLLSFEVEKLLVPMSALRSKPTLKAIQRKLYLTPNTNDQTQHIKKRALKSTRFQLALLRGLALVSTLSLACRKASVDDKCY